MNVNILSDQEALLLQATEDFQEDSQFRKAGDRWIIRGARDYIPPVQVKIIEKRRVIPLDTNEGIYVRNQRTGAVREYNFILYNRVKGQTYLLEAHEILWEKHLPDAVEELVKRAASGASYVPPSVNSRGQLVYNNEVQNNNYKRDKTRIINFKAPHNSAIQLYDYRLKKQRVFYINIYIHLGCVWSRSSHAWS